VEENSGEDLVRELGGAGEGVDLACHLSSESLEDIMTCQESGSSILLALRNLYVHPSPTNGLSEVQSVFAGRHLLFGQ